MGEPSSFWLWGGFILMLAELLVPGLVVVFLGAAAVIVGLSAAYGLTTSVNQQLLLWFVLSLGMVLLLRGFFTRLLPGQEERGQTDEDQDTLGTCVLVTQACGTDDASRGRIMLHGVEWDAVSTSEVLETGTQAIIRGRHNLTFLVERAATDQSTPAQQSSPGGGHRHPS